MTQLRVIHSIVYEREKLSKHESCKHQITKKCKFAVSVFVSPLCLAERKNRGRKHGSSPLRVNREKRERGAAV